MFEGFLNKVYSEVGKNLKNAARALAKYIILMGYILAILFFIYGLAILVDSEGETPTLFIISLIACPLIIRLAYILAWVNTAILYAFGELVDKTCEIRGDTNEIINILRTKETQSNATSCDTHITERYSDDEGLQKKHYEEGIKLCKRAMQNLNILSKDEITEILQNAKEHFESSNYKDSKVWEKKCVDALALYESEKQTVFGWIFPIIAIILILLIVLVYIVL